MESFLALIRAQAIKYAVNSGIVLTSSYALKRFSRLLGTIDDRKLYEQLTTLQNLLDGKIKVIAPTIDLIELKSGRDNVFLESARPLAQSLHRDIVCLGHNIDQIVATQEQQQSTILGPKVKRASPDDQLAKVITDVKALLDRVDREIPLLQLAITASGETLSSSLPPGISPSRLMQASTLLTLGDSQFAQEPSHPIQIGPTFGLSLYMLFLAHTAPTAQSSRDASQTRSLEGNTQTTQCRTHDSQAPYGLGEHDRKPIWQEIVHKAQVSLCRAPVSRNSEYQYYLKFVEDQDDGRVRSIADTYLEEYIPIQQASKMFYTDSGKLLNLGADDSSDGKDPVLLLKRDTSALPANAQDSCSHESWETPPCKRNSIDSDPDQAEVDLQLQEENSAEQLSFQSNAKQTHGFPPHLDPEWIAMKMFEEDVEEGASTAGDQDDGSNEPDCGEESPSTPTQHQQPLDPQLEAQIRNLSVHSSPVPGGDTNVTQNVFHQPVADKLSDGSLKAQAPFGAITTSLSLIEMVIRLASLQEFQQTSHLAIPDHVLSFFLEEASTTGLVGEAQWKARNDTKARIGFDPYTDEATR